MATKHFYRLSCAALGIKFLGSYGECTRVIERAVGTERADGRDLWQGFDRRRCNMAKQGIHALEVILMGPQEEGKYTFIIEAENSPYTRAGYRANNPVKIDGELVDVDNGELTLNQGEALGTMQNIWELCKADTQAPVSSTDAQLAHQALVNLQMGFFRRAAYNLMELKARMHLTSLGEAALNFEIAMLTEWAAGSLIPVYHGAYYI